MTTTVVHGWDFGPDQLLIATEVAQMFGVSVVTVTRWADEGKLVFVRTPGGRRRYSRQQVECLMLGPV